MVAYKRHPGAGFTGAGFTGDFKREQVDGALKRLLNDEESSVRLDATEALVHLVGPRETAKLLDGAPKDDVVEFIGNLKYRPVDAGVVDALEHLSKGADVAMHRLIADVAEDLLKDFQGSVRLQTRLQQQAAWITLRG